MSVVAINPKLTKIQNALFEQAHSQPCEVKFVAIAIKKQGLTGDKLFLHPEMFPMPMSLCPYLTTLNHKQKVILSTISYAHIYRMVARSEHQACDSNMLAAERAFVPYSDDYMVLAQETAEEFDHIWSFRTLHAMVCKETGMPEPFFTNETGFFAGEWSSRVDDERKIPFAHKALNFAIGDGMRLLPNSVAQGMGLGGLWLLYRFISNVYLKQAEAYLHDAGGGVTYDPLSVEMTDAHLTDEARHYTTSFDVGLELYKGADPWAQKVIRNILTEVMEDFIGRFFITFHEMMAGRARGYTPTSIRIGLHSLEMALNHPEFRDHQVNIKELADSWYSSGIGKELGPVIKKRWRYTAQQLERLVEALDLKLDANRMGVAYERYQKALNFSLPEQARVAVA